MYVRSMKDAINLRKIDDEMLKNIPKEQSIILLWDDDNYYRNAGQRKCKQEIYSCRVLNTSMPGKVFVEIFRTPEVSRQRCLLKVDFWRKALRWKEIDAPLYTEDIKQCFGIHKAKTRGVEG